MTDLRERTAHEPTDPTRPENRMSHRHPCSSFLRTIVYSHYEVQRAYAAQDGSG